MIVTLAGHVDHGKTSLVRALTAVDTDRLTDEKSRGLTIDLGFAYTALGGRRVGFVDVPGHHRFVHNMVAGVSRRQVALLVVAADDGPMPQTLEHLEILELLGIERGVVALSKADTVGAARLSAVRDQLSELFTGTFLDRAAVIPTAVDAPDSIEALREALGGLIEQMPADVDHHFRLAVDRSFTIKGTGVVVTGTVHSGTVDRDDAAVAAPAGRGVRVRSIHVQDRSAPRAQAGDRAALNLAGIDHDQIRRGDWVTAAAAARSFSVITVELRLSKARGHELRHWTPCHVYHATSHCLAHIALLDRQAVEPGGRAMVDLVCESSLLARRGDRMILRRQGKDATLGGAEVIHAGAQARRRRSPARLAMLDALADRDANVALRRATAIAPVDAAHLAAVWNLTEGAFTGLTAAADTIGVDGQLVNADAWHSLGESVLDTVARFHVSAPHAGGLRVHELANVLTAPRHLLLARVNALRQEGRIAERAGYYHTPGFRPRLPEAEEALYRRVEPLLDAPQPPSLGDLARRLGIAERELATPLTRWAALGLLVEVTSHRYFLPQALARLAALAETMSAGGEFTVRAFRDASDLGRNVSIDVLEHFDARGYTRRLGDLRRVVRPWSMDRRMIDSGPEE